MQQAKSAAECTKLRLKFVHKAVNSFVHELPDFLYIYFEQKKKYNALCSCVKKIEALK